MLTTPDHPATRLVLDTNTVMALWLFEDPALAPLRRAIDGERVSLVSRADTVEELRRVLAYRQFAIAAERQSDILSTYVRQCTLIAQQLEGERVSLPICRDPDDQKFLEIACDSAATHLVSRDKALLKLNRHRIIRPLFTILTPERFCAACC